MREGVRITPKVFGPCDGRGKLPFIDMGDSVEGSGLGESIRGSIFFELLIISMTYDNVLVKQMLFA